MWGRYRLKSKKNKKKFPPRESYREKVDRYKSDRVRKFAYLQVYLYFIPENIIRV